MKLTYIITLAIKIGFLISILSLFLNCSSIDSNIIYQSPRFSKNTLSNSKSLVFGATMDKIGVPEKYRKENNNFLLASQLHQTIAKNRQDLNLVSQKLILKTFSKEDYFDLLKDYQINQTFTNVSILKLLTKTIPDLRYLILLDLEELNINRQKHYNTDIQKDITNEKIEKITKTETYETSITAKIYFSIYDLELNKTIFKSRSLASKSNKNKDESVEIVDKSEDKMSFGEEVVNAFIDTLINGSEKTSQQVKKELTYPEAPGLFLLCKEMFEHFAKEVLPEK